MVLYTCCLRHPDRVFCDHRKQTKGSSSYNTPGRAVRSGEHAAPESGGCHKHYSAHRRSWAQLLPVRPHGGRYRLDRYSRHARGITLRMWAVQTLGRFYTRTLRISESQRVVQEGPYKNVRHPGYLGVILLWVGAGLATVNWIVAALVTLTVIAAYRYRINAEERMPVASFGEQDEAYMKHTWRLLPFVW